jgi:hypothetical protein
MSSTPNRYKTISKRTFSSAMEHLLEKEFKLVGSHRVIRMMVESIMELHQEFFPETHHLTPGTILWATTKAGEGAKVSWGKRAEEYGIKLVHLPLVTKFEIESRQTPGRGNNPKNNRQKQAQRDMQTMARLVKSAAEQGGLLTGAEVSVLMNRSLGKVHQYIRDWEVETGEALPMKGYVLDMGSSPTHKGIICRKFEEGMSPPDIGRATGHTLQAVDNYLGTYERIKVLLLRGFDVPTISHVTGKALRTIMQYFVIIECYQPDLLQSSHRQWMVDRRKRKSLVTPPETLIAMTESLENPNPTNKEECDKLPERSSEKRSSKKRATKRPKSRSSKG